MVIPGRSFSTTAYKWGFNGKEKDDEISGSGNQYDLVLIGDRTPTKGKKEYAQKFNHLIGKEGGFVKDKKGKYIYEIK